MPNWPIEGKKRATPKGKITGMGKKKVHQFLNS
jgi:hypothetical protein